MTAEHDRPLTAVRGDHPGPVTVLEAIAMAVAPLLPYLLPVGGFALIVYAGFLIAPPLGFAAAGLSMLVLDWQIQLSKRPPTR